MTKRLVAIGHGYSAGFLTRRLVPLGWTVTGTTRDDPARVADAGANPLRWPGEEDAVRAALARALRLSEVERLHLLELALGQPGHPGVEPPRQRGSGAPRPV